MDVGAKLLQSRKQHVEGAEAGDTAISEALKGRQTLCSGYKSKPIWNTNETGSIYVMAPDRCLEKSARHSRKKKNQITLSSWTNENETENVCNVFHRYGQASTFFPEPYWPRA